MTAIVINTERVAPVYAALAEIFPFIAGETIQRGDPVFIQTTTGKVFKSLAAAAGTAKFAGYALQQAGAGQAVDVLKKGHMYGLTLDALNAGARTYVGDTGGSDTAVGTVTVATGTVIQISDAALTKVLYVDADWLTGAYAAGA